MCLSAMLPYVNIALLLAWAWVEFVHAAADVLASRETGGKK